MKIEHVKKNYMRRRKTVQQYVHGSKGLYSIYQRGGGKKKKIVCHRGSMHAEAHYSTISIF